MNGLKFVFIFQPPSYPLHPSSHAIQTMNGVQGKKSAFHYQSSVITIQTVCLEVMRPVVMVGLLIKYTRYTSHIVLLLVYS